MQVRVNLMGALKAKAPEGNMLELPEGATINDVLQCLDISAPQIQIAMVNNRPRPNRDHALSPDDELTLVPPVGGG